MTTDQTESTPREPLDTLMERWQEVADAYQAKAGEPDDELTRRYSDYRHIYLRNIRDLKHVIETGRMPCSLMSNVERRRGDCGRNHEDEYDKHGTPVAKPETAGWIGYTAERDPWSPAPDATVSIPQPARRVIVERIADMLLSRGDDGWHAEQARRLTFALKDAGADLTGDIEKRVTLLTLGPDPSDPPF